MKTVKPVVRSGAVIWILLISACASQIPPEIRQAPENTPGVAQVYASVDNFVSQKVRWGGVILQTENKNDSSWLTIVAFPLTGRGEPLSSGQSQGRFIAVVDQFLEPLVYSADREVTIAGEVLRSETIQVDEFSYKYPVIKVDQLYLWPERSEQRYNNYPPYWYDPWYYPFHRPYYRTRFYH
jgi:outer membrane lipoprotein